MKNYILFSAMLCLASCANNSIVLTANQVDTIKLNCIDVCEKRGGTNKIYVEQLEDLDGVRFDCYCNNGLKINLFRAGK